MPGHSSPRADCVDLSAMPGIHVFTVVMERRRGWPRIGERKRRRPSDGYGPAMTRKVASMETTQLTEHFDVLIVGAGLSGIGAGYHLQHKCPGKSFVLLEGRDCIGGTWDLFRYPGIRSDSDMFTLGYSFKPWTNPKAI